MGLNIDTSSVTGFDTIERFAGSRAEMDFRMRNEIDYMPNWRWSDDTFTAIERMHPTTFTVGFMALFTGVPEITNKNYKEVFLRISMYEAVHKTALPFTLAEVKAHIGLRVNVRAKTKAQFDKTISDALREKALTLMNRLTRQEAA